MIKKVAIFTTVSAMVCGVMLYVISFIGAMRAVMEIINMRVE